MASHRTKDRRKLLRGGVRGTANAFLALTRNSGIEDSTFLQQTVDAFVAVGSMFLLHPDIQCLLIRKVRQALNFSGQFLFTSPEEKCTWQDILTHRESVSLGSATARLSLVAHLRHAESAITNVK